MLQNLYNSLDVGEKHPGKKKVAFLASQIQDQVQVMDVGGVRGSVSGRRLLYFTDKERSVTRFLPHTYENRTAFTHIS